ncbi:MAG: hypothetical protein U0930_22755 [Pirellulales bacterium]
MSDNNNDFSGWAIVEIMGHQKYAGHVSTQALGGGSMLRIDVPEVETHPPFTKMFGLASIYAITPVEELVARSMAQSLRKAPVDIYEFPRAVREAMQTQRLPSPTGTEEPDEEEECNDLDDDERPY